ncbi:hypothetical protein ACQEVZ_29860 [Dactylosporangium sp. CA-152071]|uniref:hypothetical protein n=1 Tax=Dactylosporangium sp. CA-152071 TaxID=3239933 RepID=UPI003D91F52D
MVRAGRSGGAAIGHVAAVSRFSHRHVACRRRRLADRPGVVRVGGSYGRGMLARPLVLLLLAPLALVAGCSSHKPASAAVDVAPGKSAALVMPGGARVDVPLSAVSASGRLTGTVVSSPPPAPDGLAFDGQVFDFRLDGATLTAPVKVSLPAAVPDGDQGPDVAVLAYYDPTSNSWQAAEAQYDPGAHTVVGQSPHLSVWAAFRVDTGKILEGAGDLLKGFFGAAEKARQPNCPHQDQATVHGVTVASDSGNLVKWCAGVDDQGAPVLQVADNRQYSVEIDYPDGWTVRRLGDADPMVDQAVNFVSSLLTTTPSGTRAVIVPGGHTVQFTLPPGGSGQAETRPSTPAYLMDALMYGLDTLTMTFTKLPWGPKPSVSTSAKALKLALDAKDCFSSFEGLIRNEVADGHSAGVLFRDAAKYAVGCLEKGWEIAYGYKGILGTFLIKVALWLVDGIRLAINGVQAAVDNLIYWRSYRIKVTVPASIALADASVAGIATGGSGQEVERRLRDALGAPARTEDAKEGCSLGGQPAVPRRHFVWGALDVVVDNPGTSKSTLVGWTVRSGALPANVTLPYDVTMSTSVKQALTKIPGAKGEWQDPFQVYLVQTPKAPNTSWMGPAENGSGNVDEITNMWEPCD